MIPTLGQLWELARTAGPFGTAIMFYIWMRTDKERRKNQKEKDLLLERVLTSMNKVNEALRDLTLLLSGGGRRH